MTLTKLEGIVCIQEHTSIGTAKNRGVHLSMLNYIMEALKYFHHTAPNKPHDQTHSHIKPKYGANVQYAEDQDISPLLEKEGRKFIPKIVGTVLYYSRAVDCTMLAALGSIATQQENPTKSTTKKVNQFINYAATHPDIIVTYRASNMILAIHSDALYLSETNARSRVVGYFYVSDNSPNLPNNGAIITIAQIIKQVMLLATEAKLGALYINCREAIPTPRILQEMGQPQLP